MESLRLRLVRAVLFLFDRQSRTRLDCIEDGILVGNRHEHDDRRGAVELFAERDVGADWILDVDPFQALLVVNKVANGVDSLLDLFARILRRQRAQVVDSFEQIVNDCTRTSTAGPADFAGDVDFFSWPKATRHGQGDGQGVNE